MQKREKWYDIKKGLKRGWLVSLLNGGNGGQGGILVKALISCQSRDAFQCSLSNILISTNFYLLFQLFLPFIYLASVFCDSPPPESRFHLSCFSFCIHHLPVYALKIRFVVISVCLPFRHLLYCIYFFSQNWNLLIRLCFSFVVRKNVLRVCLLFSFCKQNANDFK